MAQAHDPMFRNRLGRIDRSHRKLSSGYVQLVEKDGVLVPVPHRRIRSAFPYRGMLVAIAGFLVFKAFLFASLGEGVYNFRVERIADGTVFERAAAWVMQADPITRYISSFVAQFL